MILHVSCPQCGGKLFNRREDGPAVWGCRRCGRRFQAALAPSSGIRRGR